MKNDFVTIIHICYNSRSGKKVKRYGTRTTKENDRPTPAGSSLAKLLTDAAARLILLEKNGDVFLLERMGSEEKTPSPEDVTRSKDGTLKAAGRT
jgi:hypothetical protein